MAGVGTTIDVAPFVGESRPADAATAAAVAEEWDQTFTSSGFAQIVGHGVDPALVAALRSAAADFFALPLEEKLAHQRELGEPASTTLGSYSPNSTVAPQLGDHDDPLEGYTFYRPPDGDWMRIMAPELGHPTALAAAARVHGLRRSCAGRVPGRESAHNTPHRRGRPPRPGPWPHRVVGRAARSARAAGRAEAAGRRGLGRDGLAVGARARAGRAG